MKSRDILVGAVAGAVGVGVGAVVVVRKLGAKKETNDKAKDAIKESADAVKEVVEEVADNVKGSTENVINAFANSVDTFIKDVKDRVEKVNLNNVEKNIGELMFKIEVVNKYAGGILYVNGNLTQILNGAILYNRVSDNKEDGRYIKFSDGFNKEAVFNVNNLTVEDIAKLIVNGGSTECSMFRLLGEIPEVTIEEVSDYIKDLYIKWDSDTEDFPSYLLDGINN
jgi:gas vesicle protein